MNARHSLTRRSFLARTGPGAVALAAGFPAIVPSRVFGRTAPSNRINVGAIGTGRISRGHDMPGVWKDDSAQIVAVCDVDNRRVEDARALVNGHYSSKLGQTWNGVRTYRDYRDLLSDADVDAVLVSTPDHWHALIAIHAVEAGKDVYLQKPASLTIAEGRALSNAVHKSGRIFQIGSQQRSSPQFRFAAELVRNGRIGRLTTVQVGLPGDPAGDDEPEMPVPANLDYESWLGSTPYVYYTEKRVHPQVGYDRPGWLRCEQFGAGMITGWGSHHIDCAHWAMDTEHTGPVEISGTAEFPDQGALERPRPLPDGGPLRQRRPDDRERRLSQRHPIRRHRRVDLRLTGKREGHEQRSRGQAQGRSGSVGQRPADPRVGHRSRRGPPLREPRSPRQLARLHPLASAPPSPLWRWRTAPARRACSTTSP